MLEVAGQPLEHRPVEQCLRIGRVQLDGPTKVKFSRVKLAQFVQRHRQVAVGVGVIGHKFEGAAGKSGCLSRITLISQRRRQIAMCLGIVGAQLQGTR